MESDSFRYASGSAPSRIVGVLLSAKINEKQARSIKHQLTIANLPLAEDIADFQFDWHADQPDARQRSRRRWFHRSGAQRCAGRRHLHRQDPLGHRHRQEHIRRFDSSRLRSSTRRLLSCGADCSFRPSTTMRHREAPLRQTARCLALPVSYPLSAGVGSRGLCCGTFG